MATAKPTKNPTYLVVKAIAYAMFLLGLGLSVVHIYGLFRDTLHASFATALFVPVFIDGLQLVGRMIRGHQFAKSTRTAGYWLQGFGALVSLLANVIAGHAIGDKVGGAIFVVGYILIEAVAEVIRPETDDAQVAQTVATQAAAAKRSASAQKAAATRAANKARRDAEAAAKAEQEQARRERDTLARRLKRAEVAALNAQYAAPAAPVSPAPIGHDAAYL